MVRNFEKLVGDEAGFVITAELVLVLTIAVLAMVVGLTAVRDSITQEMNDLAHAFGTVNQTYTVSGLSKARCHGSVHAAISGFGFNDRADDCDCNPIQIIDVCGKDDPSQGGPESGSGS